MAKITALPVADQIVGTEHLPIVQGDTTKRVTMAAFRDLITPFLQYWYKGDRGDVGEAANTFASIARMKALDPVRYPSAILADSIAPPITYAFVHGNYTGQANDIDIVALDAVPIAEGALVRQGARGISFRAGKSAIVETAEDALARTVHVESFMYATDADATAGFQRAIDALTSGGVIRAHGPLYRVQSVYIRPDITIDLASGTTLLRVGQPGLDSRGMFQLRNLFRANFILRGGTIDLNGEGPMGIGIVGRIANTYAVLNSLAPVKGLNGPVNAAVYGLRSGGIQVLGTRIVNTGESGILLRNCGDIVIERAEFANIGNCGVEISIADAADDGGIGPMPARDRVAVRNSFFTDIEDFGLGTGNGCGIQVGGAGGQGKLADYDLSGNSYTRCQRDWHFEFEPGTWVEGVTCTGFRSYMARQGSFGMIGVRKATVSGVIRNPGAAPTAALTYDALSFANPEQRYPAIYGGVLSGDVSQTDVNVLVTDNRNQIVVKRLDGAIDKGSDVLSAPGAAFIEADIGKWVGILGANPQDVALVAVIVDRLDATRVRLDRVAHTDVANAPFAYGGACREGIIVSNIVSANIWGMVEGGVASGLPNEPRSAAVRVEGVTERVRLTDLSLNGRGDASTPVGLRLVGGSGFTGRLRARSYSIDGFAAPVVGLDEYRAVVEGEFYQTPNGTQIQTGDAKSEYGAVWQALPRGCDFKQLTDLSVEFSGLAVSEAVTIEITALRYDGVFNQLFLTSLSNQTVILTPAQKWELNEDNAPIRAVRFRAMSGKDGSVARLTLVMMARQ